MSGLRSASRLVRLGLAILAALGLSPRKRQPVVVRRSALLLAFLALAPAALNAATYTWDVTAGDSATITDGPGTWVDGGPNWNLLSSPYDFNWTDNAATPDSAVFGGGSSGTAGTVSVSGTINVASITFNAPFAGAYTLSGGAITLGGSSGGGGVTVNAGDTANETISSPITLGNTAVAATYTFTNSSTTANDLLTLGTLTGGTGGTAGAIALNFAGAGNISAGAIADGGATMVNLSKSGAGVLTLTSANTYSGSTAVSAGTVNLSNSLAIQNSTLTTAGIVFDSSIGSHAFTFGGLSGSGNIALQDNAGSPNAVALTVGGNNAITSYSGVLSGAGSLTKTGSGALTLSVGNTFTGNLVINNGTITDSFADNTGTPTSSGVGNLTTVGRQIQINSGGNLLITANDALGSATVVQNASIVINGGSLTRGNAIFTTLGNVTLQNGATLTGGNGVNSSFQAFNIIGTVTVNGTSGSTITTTGSSLTGTHLGGNTTFAVSSTGSAADLTVATPLIDKAGGGAGGFSKTGAGNMVLTGASTYTGNTLVQGGTLTFNGGSKSGGGLIDIGAVGVASTNFVLTSGSVTAGGQFVVGAHGSNSASSQAAGTTLQVNGTFYLGGYGEGASTDVGTYTQSGGTVTITSGINFGGGGPNSGVYILSGGTLTTPSIARGGSGLATFDFNGGTLRSSTNSFSMSGLTTANVQAGGAIVDTNTLSFTIAQALVHDAALGAAADGGLTKSGSAGTLTLNGADTFTGNTLINVGTLQLGNNLALQNSPFDTSSAGTLAFSSGINTPTFGGLIGSTNLTLASNVTGLTLNVGTGLTKTYSGVLGSVTPGMSLTNAGAGTQILSGANSYTGATNTNAGILQFNGSSSLPAGSAINLGAGTFRIHNDGAGSNGTIAVANSITLSSGVTTATIDVGNNGSANTGNTVAFGALNNGTTANALLSTINFTGANGYLQSFPSLGLSGLTGQNTTLNPTTTSVTILGNVTNQESGSVTGHFDTLTLDGTSTGNVINGIISDNAGFVSVNNGDTRVTKSNSSTWTLAGANTYSGPTSVTGGTLIIATGGSITGTSKVDATGGSTLSVFGTVSMAANGNFGVGSSTVGGGTTGFLIVNSGGVLNIGNGANGSVGYTAIGGSDTGNGSTGTGTGTLTINTGGIVNVAASGTLTGFDTSHLWLNPYGGSGSTINLNGGTLSSARQIANGSGGTAALNFNGGTLQLAGASDTTGNFLQVTTNVRNSGGTIDTQAFNLTVNQALAHSTIGGDNAVDGGITKMGLGTLTLGGGNTFTGNFVVNNGTVIDTVSANSPTPTSTGVGNMTTSGKQVQINSGGTLQFNTSDSLGNAFTLQNGSVVINGGTLTHANGVFNTLGNVTLQNGATITGGNGAAAGFQAYNIMGNVTVSGTSGSTITSNGGATLPGVNLGVGTITFTVASTGAGPDLTVAVPLLDKVNSSGAGGVIKTGAGIMVMSATNTYTGVTTVQQGVLDITAGTTPSAGLSKIGSSGNTATLQIAGGTYNDTSGGIDIGQLGSTATHFVLSSGTVNAATQFAIGAHSTADGTQTGGALAITGTFYDGDYADGAGTGTYTQSAGTVTATGDLNFNGGGPNNGIYNLNGGTLTVAHVSVGAGTGTGTVNLNGGTLKAAASGFTMSGLAAANVQAGGLTFDTNTFSATIGQALVHDSGLGATLDGGLTKSGGSGVLSLTAANTYTGPTNINAGAIQLGNASAVQNSTVNVNVNGGLTFAIGTNAPVFGGLAGSGNISLQDGSTAAVNPTIGGNNASTAYSGILSGAGGITKTGSGALTLTGANSNTGPTQITGGSLILNGSAAGTLTATGMTVGSGATLAFTTGSASTLTMPSGSTFTLGGGTIGFDIGAAGINDMVAADTFSLTANSSFTFNTIGAISSGSTYTLATYNTLLNSGSFTIAGQTSGRLTLTPVIGTNAITITPTLSQAAWNSNSGGNWSVGPWTNYTPSIAGDAALFGTSPGLVASDTIAVDVPETVGFMTFNNTSASYTIGSSSSSNLTLDNGASAAVVAVLNGGSHTIAENVALNGNVLVSTDPGATLTLSGAWSGTGKSLTKGGAGALVLSGASTFDGGLNIQNGTVRVVGGTNRLSTSTALVLGNAGTTGKLILGDGTGTADQTLAGATVTGGGGSIVGGNAANSTLTLNIASGTDQYDGLLGGAGMNENNLALVKSGNGTLRLTATQTFTGGTTVTAGVLQLGTTNTMSANSVAVNVNGGLQFAAGITAPNLGALSGTGNIVLQDQAGSPAAVILAIGGTGLSSSYAGALSGPGGITKAGSSTFTLNGASTYTGATLVTGSSSILTIGATGSLTGVGNINETANGSLTISGMVTMANAKTFGIGSGVTGTMGSVTVNSGGTLNIGGGNGNTFIGGDYINAAGNGRIGQQGTGALIINGGTLNVAAGGTSGNGPGGLDSTSLWLNPYGGSGSSIMLSGGGILSTARRVANGAGGAATFTFDNGTLRAAASINLLDAQGPLAVNLLAGGATIDSNGFNPSIVIPLLHSGSGTDGGLTKNGAGTLTLTAANTYNGGTIVNAGTLTLSGSGNLGATNGNLAVNSPGAVNLGGNSRTVGAVTIGGGTISNGTLTGTGFTSTGGTVSAALAGSGAPLTLNSGALTLSGAISYTGATTVNGGSLILNGAAAVGTPTTAFTVAGGSFGFTTGSASTLALGTGSTFTLSGGTLNFDLGAAGVNDLITADTFTLGANSSISANLIDSVAFGSPYTVATFNTLNNPGSSTLSGAVAGRVIFTPTLNSNSITITPTLQQSAWNSTAGGNWSAGPWTSYTPSVAGDAALFDSAAGLLSGSGVIAVDQPESVGYMTFNSATASYTIGTTGSSHLTLDNGASVAVLTVNAGSHTIKENVALNSSLAVQTDPGTTLTINGLTSGSGKGLTKSGAGTLALTAANTFSGPTVINGGTLQIGDGVTQLGNYGLYSNGTGTITVNNGGTLSFRSIDAFGGANNSNPITVVANQGGLVTNGKWTGNYSDAHSAGFNTLNNLHLSGGTLRGVGALNGNAAITPYGAFNVVGTVLVDGTTQSTISQAISTDSDYIGPNGFMTLALGTTTFNVLDNTTGTDLLVSASLNNFNGSVSNLTKTGAGTMSLTGVNGWTGATSVTGGTLNFATGGSLPSAGNINETGGGALTISGSVTMASGKTFGIGSGVSGTTGFVTVNAGGSLSIGAGAGNTFIGGDYINSAGNGKNNLYGTGSLTINGGTVNVAAGGGTTTSGPGGLDDTHLYLNPYGGSGSSITLSGGGILSTARPIDNGTLGATATFNFNGGTLQAASSAAGNILDTFVDTMTVKVQAGGATIDTNSFNATVLPALLHDPALGSTPDGGFTKNGTGVLTLSGADTYTGGTTVNNGTLRMNNATALGSVNAPLTVNGGALDLNGNSLGVGNLTGTGGSIYNNLAGSVTLTIGNNDTGGGNYAGVIADNSGTGGTLSLVKTGAGAITLSGPNTYSGGTTLNGLGTLRVANTSGSATGTGNVTLNGGTLTSGPAGAIGGNVLAGSVNPHTIAPGGVGAFGTLSVGGLTTASNTTLTYDLGAPVSGGMYTGDLINIGTGGLTVGSGTTLNFAFTGTPNAVGDYRLFGGSFGTPSQSNFSLPTAPMGLIYSLLSPANDSAYYDLVISYSAQSGTWNVNGPGTFSYNVASSWDSAAIPNAPGLVATFANGNPAFATPAGPITVTVDALDTVGTLAFNSTAISYTLAGDNVGGHGLSLDNNGIAAAINVTAGSHTITAPVALVDGVAVTTAADPMSGPALTMSGVISGVGGLTKSGAGTLALGNATTPNSYAGGTTISGGVLRTVGNGGALPSGTVTLNPTARTATLRISSTETITNLSATPTGAGVTANINVDAGKTLTVNGGGTNGQTTVALADGGATLSSGGALSLVGPTTVGQSSSISVTGGTTALTGSTSLGNNALLAVSGTGTLHLEVASGAAVGTGVSVTVTDSASLELAGGTSALTDTNIPLQRANIVNSSTSPNGVDVISGSQQVGGIDGNGTTAGNVVVDDGASLIADHINQTSLVIGDGSTFTLAPSDMNGNPMVSFAAANSGLALAGSLTPSSGFVATSGSLLGVGSSASPATSVALGGVSGAGVSAVPEPSTIALLLLGGMAAWPVLRRSRRNRRTADARG